MKAVTAVEKIKGKGDYKVGGVKILGNPKTLGGHIGGWLGDKAQSFISSIFGMGDYAVKANTLLSPNPPMFTQGRHSMTVCHREFVAPVNSLGILFNLTAYPINPTSALFPWLSSLATSFELFRFKGLVIEFVATSATAVSSTNTALGSVILATEYNTLAPNFISQVQMEAYEYSTSTVPFTSCIHPIECDPAQLTLSELYTDLGFSTGDPRFTTLGNFQIATIGQQAAAVIGELWVSYEVELIRPRILGGLPSAGLSNRVSSSSVAAYSLADMFNPLAAAVASNLANGNLLANTTSVPTGTIAPPNVMSLDVIFGSPTINGYTANTIQFPYGVFGSYMIILRWIGGSSVTLAYPGISITGGGGLPSGIQLVTPLGYSGGTSGPLTYPAVGASSTSACMIFYVQIFPASSQGAPIVRPTIAFSVAGTVLPFSLNLTGSLTCEVVQISA